MTAEHHPHHRLRTSFVHGFAWMGGLLAAMALGVVIAIFLVRFYAHKTAQKNIEVLEQMVLELEQENAALDQHLELVEILAVRILPPDPQDTFRRNKVEITVRNNRDVALAELGVDCELKAPDRAVPLAKGTAHFSPSGGLNPGEEKTLKKSLYDGSLQRAEIPEGAIFAAVASRAVWAEK